MVENGGGVVFRGGEGEWEGDEVIVEKNRWRKGSDYVEVEDKK